ncbi:YceI family protein [Vicingaceae bacterium]|nr:YceI family protein [Vicingaceae bacterium]MDB4061845.1 YceI family protein [Vicingaceae bacterium]
MKKLFKPGLSIIAIATMVACGGAADKSKEVSEETEVIVEEVTEETVNVNANESSVMWMGQIIGGIKSHNGTVKVTEGLLTLKGDEIVAGNFTVDLTSMNPVDSNYTEDQPSEKLVGHLSSGDFFMTDSFPTASFVVTSADMAAMTVTGDLTVRGVTNSETINDVAVDTEAGTAIGSLTFDRQKYNVAFSTGAKDFVLSDDIELTINLKM